MIIFISDKQVQRNLKKVGYNNVGTGVTELLNKVAYNYVRKEINKVIKSNQQKGGRVLMPSEYFGVPSNHYVTVTDKTFNGNDMTVKDTWIRPSFKSELNGGEAAPIFTVSQKSVKNMVSEVINTKKCATKITSHDIKYITSNLVSKLSEVVKSLQKKVKSDRLERQDLLNVLSMSKFKSML